MEYSYLQDRQDNHPNPEMSQAHPQSQYPFSSPQQQPFPPSHLHIVSQEGYPTVRFAPFLNPLQGTGPSQSHVTAHHQEALLHPRISTPDSTTTSSADTLQGQRASHGFDGMLGASIGGGSSLHQLEPVASSSQHVSPLSQHLPPAHRPSLSHREAPYIIHDGASPSRSGSYITSLQTSSGNAASTAGSGPVDASSSARQLKRRRQAHVGQQQQPLQSPIHQEPVLKAYKSCQTEPMFEVTGFRGVLKASPELPDGLSYIEIDQEERSLGVMATRDFKAGEEFGPFTGEFMKNGLGCYNLSTWELCVKENICYINGTSDPRNWMSHIHLARSKEEQNLEALQFYGNIFFRTTRKIESGTELRVFYGKDYSKHVGFRTSLEELHLDKATGKFACRECKCRYTNPKSLLRHIKFEHDKENNPFIEDKPQEAAADGEDQKAAEKSQRTPEPLREVNSGSEKRQLTRAENDCKVDVGSSHADKERVPAVPKKVASRSQNKRKPLVTQKLYTCKKCGKNFPSEGRWLEHAAFHREAKKIRPVCAVCGLECRNERALKRHKVSHDSNAIVCPLCKKCFLRKYYFAAHLRNDHKMKRDKAKAKLKELLNPGSTLEREKEADDNDRMVSEHICEVCELGFEDDETLKEHESIHKSSFYSCAYCKKKFDRKAHFVDHLAEDHDLISRQFPTRAAKRKQISELVVPLDQKEPEEHFHESLAKDMIGKKLRTSQAKFFKCKFCPNMYTKLERVVEHMQLVHTNSGKYQCEFCPQTFSNETESILHKRLHTKDRPYKCAECSFSFASESALKNHQVEHSDARPVKCDVCGKGFSCRKNLNSHKRRLHKTQTRPHKCTFCDKSFSNRTGLRRHEQRHKGIRPFVCIECGRAFGTKYGLIHHSRTHTGERPYECMFCKKTFTMNHHLARHLIRHEKSEDPDKFSAVIKSTVTVSNKNGSNGDDDEGWQI